MAAVEYDILIDKGATFSLDVAIGAATSSGKLDLADATFEMKLAFLDSSKKYVVSSNLAIEYNLNTSSDTLTIVIPSLVTSTLSTIRNDEDLYKINYSDGRYELNVTIASKVKRILLGGVALRDGIL
jgi:hypothetical protein